MTNFEDDFPLVSRMLDGLPLVADDDAETAENGLPRPADCDCGHQECPGAINGECPHPSAEKHATEELCRRIEAWIRHGEAVPPNVLTYDRWIVHEELRQMVADARATRVTPSGGQR